MRPTDKNYSEKDSQNHGGGSTFPNIVLSRCLLGESCRYNGEKLEVNAFITFLKEIANLIPVCPEVEIGLGVPRDPIRVILKESSKSLVQSHSGKDLTRRMIDFSAEFSKREPEVDGFILKSRSPSCGVFDTKIYSGWENDHWVTTGAGLFTEGIMTSYENVVVDDEARLSQKAQQENFLLKIFAHAALRCSQKISHREIRDLRQKWNPLSEPGE